MNRQVLFRGKRIDNGKWVYGYYFQGFTGISYILVMHDHILGVTEYYEVDSATVGQYTGLKDKNGKEIYDGDIVKLCDTNPVIFIIEIELAPRSGYKFKWIHADDKTRAEGYFLDRCEVIGTIFDNPDLIGGHK